SEFQQAIDLDPKYALAYSGLADAYTTKAGVTSGHDSELYEKARALTTTALALDPNLADAHNSLAQVKYYYDWNWPAAEESFKKALELEPNNVNAHQFYGRLLATMGRYDEAIAEIQKARELDPRSADLLVPLFAVLEKRSEFDEALRVLETSLNMEGDLQIAKRAVGKIHLLKGDFAKVIELSNELFPPPDSPDLFWTSMLATAFHKTGQENRAAEMQARLVKLSKTDSKALYFLAMHYSELNRRNEAIAALEKCLELREDRMVWTKDEPRFAGIKDDPRFNQILKRLNLS
ncbi:MAG TPA: tetratricopeptide repeat protein, partial [Pyrinomonadaceae bacterium]|nr:tetratricopeptide repeat protein [Pyrinomonadaceae bacterium]